MEGERAADKALSEKSRRLEEAHTALSVLLERYHEDRAQLREGVLTNVREMIVPYLEKLRRTKLDQTQTEYVDIIQRGLAYIVSPFAIRISSRTLNLTRREIEVAYLIREGKTTKQIARFLNLSPRAVDTHRYNLRRKLGIGAKKINLRSHILSLAEIQDFGILPAKVLEGTHSLKDSARPGRTFNGKCGTLRFL
ncbi:MAG: helix-turn-helix transcriptional regulator [Syntrophorhabdales bacterium]|jgi:DNA-binding CsgD family transcriptional regulator